MVALGVKQVEKFEAYLGLPTLVGRAKYQTFSYLKDRVWKKLQGWKGRMLSRAEKEMLIKAVAQSIPTYTLGVFLLPVKLCDELNVMSAKFWWGQVRNERKIHWKNWSILSWPKYEVGMGFRDLRFFNLAILAKHGWRLLHDQSSLLFQCFKARYFPQCNFLDAVESPNYSYAWKSMVTALPILKSGCCWRVGNGESIKVYLDKWIPKCPANRILQWGQHVDREMLVSKLIDVELNWWRRDIIMENFCTEEAAAICKIPLS